MVTSQKMNENEMDYRGSKSKLSLYPQPKDNFVKEQRVDGSWLLASNALRAANSLRCTLMGFERNYQVKIPSKQFRYFSSLPEQNLNPWFITGFTDAEGCFSIKVQKNIKLKTNWRIRPVFSITLGIKDLSLLEKIQQTLGVGKIFLLSNSVMYSVDSIKEIPVIINHFDQYPLITNKFSDYLIFKQCFDIIRKGDHLNERGLLEIIALKSYLNLGLNSNLKNTFPNIIAIERPKFIFKNIPDPFWVSGFVNGEGSFHVILFPSTRPTGGDGGRVLVRFSIHLHIRDLEVLKGIADYLSIDKKIGLSEKSANLQISNFSDIINKVIPFFNKFKVIGMKGLDFEDFKKISFIVQTKDHLKSESVFNEIVKIKAGMNLNRK